MNLMAIENWPVVDWVLLAVFAVSTLLGLVRGFAGVVVSLGSWFLALFAASSFAGYVAVHLPESVQPPSLRLGIAFAVIFALVLLSGSMLGKLLAATIRQLGLGPSDRFLGLLFGAARGSLIVLAFVLLAGMTPLKEDPWWGESRVIGVTEPTADWLSEKIPGLSLPLISDNGGESPISGLGLPLPSPAPSGND